MSPTDYRVNSRSTVAEHRGAEVADRLRLTLCLGRSAGGYGYEWRDGDGRVRVSGWAAGKRQDGVSEALTHLGMVHPDAERAGT